MPKLHLRLTLDVWYETGGASKKWLADNLMTIAQSAHADGNITCGSDAEIERYAIGVDEPVSTVDIKRGMMNTDDGGWT